MSREPGSILLQRAPSAMYQGRSLLFRKPESIVEARQPCDVPKAFATLERLVAKGFYLAGYIAYEAGFALESALADLATTMPNEEPLLWFGCYRNPEVRDETLPFVSSISPASPIHPGFSLQQEAYEEKVERVRDLIASGETYQANLTMDVEWNTDDPPEKLYTRLFQAQPVSYAALLHPKPDWHVLSLSPELFFERQEDYIRTRPMKGTAAPGMDVVETRSQVEWLRTSEKDRAENVMIVDLLRSDLGRICQMGSVRVTNLFEVEKYPTVLQMTSTVEGRLREHVRYKDIFSALFPSGSIVGAPKIHTMRLLHELEKRRRGVYTGTIGYIAPDNQAEFNVAIRTISLREGKARLGVGSGITFDSEPKLEYAECLTKTMFLRREPEQNFALIETLLLDEGKFIFLDEHLDRIAQSAEYFEFAFDISHMRQALQEAALSWKGEDQARVRLLLDRTGRVTYTTSRIAGEGCGSVDLLLSRERVSPGDLFFRHKTTNRALYDTSLSEAQAQGFADCLFRNTREEVSEGAIHNIIGSIDGEWVTPPLTSGLLPGIYRRHLLDQEKISERVLPFCDLLRAEAVLICNSVRGIRRVTRIVEQRESEGEPVPIWTDLGFSTSAISERFPGIAPPPQRQPRIFSL